VLRVRSDAEGTEGIEKDVDEALEAFNVWYKGIQSVGAEDRIPIGLVPGERAAIKTFIGYYLGVGGHYTPTKA
jgi:hypothetical protein